MSDGGWIGIASLAITGVIGLCQLWIKRGQDEKIKVLQEENVVLKSQNVTQAHQINNCQDAHKDCQEETAKVKAELLARDERDKRELLVTIAAQQKRIDALEKHNKR